MIIEFSGNKREYTILQNKFRGEFEDLFCSGQFLQGKHTLELENKFSKTLNNGAYCKAVGSGTDALFLALKALIPENISLNIAVPAMTFVATVSAIVRAGHVPIVIDVDQQGLLNPADLESKLHSVDAVIYVTLYGQNEKFPEIAKLVKNSGKLLIEDAAQSDFPANYYFPEAEFPDASALSFDPMKIFSAVGSGGAVITYSSELNNIVNDLMYHGRQSSRWGINSQLSELSAFALCKKIELHLRSWKDRRLEISKYIANSIHQSMEVIGEINESNAFHKLVIRMSDEENRNKCLQHLLDNGVACRIHYRETIPMSDKFQKFIDPDENYSGSEQLSKTVITIPNYPHLTDGEVDYIVDSLKSYENS